MKPKIDFMTETVIPRVKELGYAGWSGDIDDNGNESVPFFIALQNAVEIHNLNIPQHKLDYIIKSHCQTQEDIDAAMAD